MNRINNFEALRGILALWVILFHVSAIAGIQASSLGFFSFLFEGIHAVDVFIIMSGFFIFLLLDSKQEGYMNFITRRFFRLFPAYLICLLLSVAMLDFSISALNGLPQELKDTPLQIARFGIFESSKKYFIVHLIAHLSMLHGLLPHYYLPYSAYAFLGVAWSITLEWQFYLIAPALKYIFNLKNKFFVSILIAISILLYLKFKSGAYMGFLPQKLPFFFLGIASFYAWKQKESIPLLLITTAAVFLLVSKVPVLLWGLIFLITYLGKPILDRPLLLYLGKISYSIYLCHMILVYLALSLFNKFIPENHWLFLVELLAIVLPLTLLFAHFLYHFVEKPCMIFAKKISLIRKTTEAISLTAS